MLCADLMKRDVATCFDTSTVSDAAVTMRDRDVGFLPVCDETGVVLGTLTDRDVVVRVLAKHHIPEATVVDQVMTHDLVSCRPEDELSVAEDLMIRFQKSRIVCTDASGHVAGVISLTDIAKKEEPSRHAGAIASSIAPREAAPSILLGGEPTCAEVMQGDVDCCSRGDTVPRIAFMMRERNVGFLPVCDPDGRVIGTLTDRDLVLRVVAARRYPEVTRAEDVLTPELVFCSPDDTLKSAEQLMAQYKKSRLLVSDADRHPIGVISLSDIARAEPARTVSRLLRDVSERRP
jgi:CBS domain-containing protein